MTQKDKFFLSYYESDNPVEQINNDKNQTKSRSKKMTIIKIH
jgi:hypothetical protein